MKAGSLFVVGLLSLAALTVSSVANAGDMVKEKNMNKGWLSSDEIADRLVGKTVTFVSASGKKKVLVHYGEDNVISGKQLVGGNWTGTGHYGVANDDSICLSWDKRDKGRLRCLNVLLVDGVVWKQKADGSLSGKIVKFEEGKTF